VNDDRQSERRLASIQGEARTQFGPLCVCSQLTASMSVELGDDDTSDCDCALERLRLVARRLTDRRVHGEHDIIGLNHASNLRDE